MFHNLSLESLSVNQPCRSNEGKMTSSKLCNAKARRGAKIPIARFLALKKQPDGPLPELLYWIVSGLVSGKFQFIQFTQTLGHELPLKLRFLLQFQLYTKAKSQRNTSRLQPRISQKSGINSSSSQKGEVIHGPGLSPSTKKNAAPLA